MPPEVQQALWTCRDREAYAHNNVADAKERLERAVIELRAAKFNLELDNERLRVARNELRQIESYVESLRRDSLPVKVSA